MWGSGSGETENVQLDASTNAMVVIPYEHHEVHDGTHFTYTRVDSDFDIADEIVLLIITPDTDVAAHVLFNLTAAFDTTVELWENTAALGHGSSGVLDVFNNNRNADTVNTTTINDSDGGGADGTLIFLSHFGISTGLGANQVIGGGSGRADEEWVLRRNSKYLFKVTSGTDNSSVSIKLSWYEHQDVH